MEKRKLRVVVGCDEGKVPRKHLGDCLEFCIYDVYEDGSYQLIETKPNTLPEEKQHADPAKMQQALKELAGCEVMVSGLLSPNFIRMRDTKPVQPVVIQFPEIEDVMRILHENFDHIYSLVEARRQGERPKEIPIYR